MYVYIYDDFLNSGKYDKTLHKVEKRLTDLGLNGKIVRLGMTKNLKAAIDDEIRQGAKTIVAVGDDETTAKVVNVMVNNQSEEKHRLCLGIIPIGKNNQLADIFGIKNLDEACETLLGRRLETVFLSAVNNKFFIFKVEAQLAGSIIEIDKNFIVQPTKPAILEISNNPKNNSKDKSLSLKIKEGNKESLFFFQEIVLSNQGAPLISDGALEIKTPARISLSDEKIKIIVGKERGL